MPSLRWADVADDFAWDGALRDVYVFDTDVDAWQAAWDAIRTRYRVTMHGGFAPPTSLRELFALEERPAAKIDADGLKLG